MATYAYVRVSNRDQNEERQLLPPVMPGSNQKIFSSTSSRVKTSTVLPINVC